MISDKNNLTPYGGPKRSEDGPFHELFLMLGKIPAQKRPKLILIDKFRMLICDGERMTLNTTMRPHGTITGLSFDRGEVLELFAKVEFLINTLVLSYIKPTGGSFDDFNKLLDSTDLFSKIKVLMEWGVLSPKLGSKLISIKKVRNSFAHRWSEDDVLFEGKPLNKDAVFEKFVKEITTIWMELIKISQSIQPDIKELLKKYAVPTE